MPQTKTQSKALEVLKKIDPQLEITWSKNRLTPNRLRGRLTKPAEGKAEAIALQFLKENKNLFPLESPEEELFLKNITSDRGGSQHIRYQQIFKKLPIFGSELIVHLDSQNVVRGLNGKINAKIKLDVKPAIADEKVEKIVLKHAPGNKPIAGRKPLLLILIRENKPWLAWHLTVDGVDKGLDNKEMPAVWEYFVDAKTGNVLWRYNNLQYHTRTTGSGVGYYSAAVSINTLHNHLAAQYELEDRWLPTAARIYTHDCNNGPTPGVISSDANNNWNAADQGQEVDSHLYSRMVYDYYLMVHGRDSYDDAGADMHIHAHFGNHVNNAYWSPTEQLVKIGDGDGVTRDSYCCLDVIAHEWTHAVTENTAGLVYSGESGALNESVSDVFAALIDGDWLQGEDYWLPATAPASRNLADPTNGGQYDPADPINSVIAGHQPDHTDDQYTGFDDNGGVHINSGIMNKAAYLIATGGIHRGITICEGLGREVLGRLYYQVLTNHLISSSDFADMREAVLDSLDDLYGGDPRYSRWSASIINAFAAVGIGSSVQCPGVCWIAPTICPPSPHVLCPPSPNICLFAPSFICPPSPQIICPPSPLICKIAPSVGCSVGPIVGCLPGPDPTPFNKPDIVILPEFSKKDIIEIAGIGKEWAALLKKQKINTIGDLARVACDNNGIKTLAQKTGISEKRITNWAQKASMLTKQL